MDNKIWRLIVNRCGFFETRSCYSLVIAVAAATMIPKMWFPAESSCISITAAGCEMRYRSYQRGIGGRCLAEFRDDYAKRHEVTKPESIHARGPCSNIRHILSLPCVPAVRQTDKLGQSHNCVRPAFGIHNPWRAGLSAFWERHPPLWPGECRHFNLLKLAACSI